MKSYHCIFIALCLLSTFRANSSEITLQVATNSTFFQDIEDFAWVESCDTNATGTLTIPDAYQGYPVLTIGDEAFKDCTRLEDIILPPSLCVIQAAAFTNCSITNFVAPPNLSVIFTSAFQNCDQLERIDFSAITNQYLCIDGWDVMANCDTLKEVVLPRYFNHFSGFRIFTGCPALKSIIIPPESQWYLPEIQDSMFALTGLEQFEIPTFIKRIDSAAFFGCEHLTNITFQTRLSEISDHAFAHCTSLEKIILPPSVAHIDYSAFLRCTNLQSVIVHGNTPWLGNYCSFDGCTPGSDVFSETHPDLTFYGTTYTLGEDIYFSWNWYTNHIELVDSPFADNSYQIELGSTTVSESEETPHLSLTLPVTDDWTHITECTYSLTDPIWMELKPSSITTNVNENTATRYFNTVAPACFIRVRIEDTFTP